MNFLAQLNNLSKIKFNIILYIYVTKAKYNCIKSSLKKAVVEIYILVIILALY